LSPSLRPPDGFAAFFENGPDRLRPDSFSETTKTRESWTHLRAPGFSIFTKGNMANYYTNISMVLSLPNQAAQEYALNLAQRASQVQQGDEPPSDFPKDLADVIEDWTFETDADHSAEGHGIWLHSDTGGVDALCAFLRHLLQKFNPQGHAAFEWSHDCSKPRVDAYGGGAALVTATKIQTMNTGQWLQERVSKLAAAKESSCPAS